MMIFLCRHAFEELQHDILEMRYGLGDVTKGDGMEVWGVLRRQMACLEGSIDCNV